MLKHKFKKGKPAPKSAPLSNLFFEACAKGDLETFISYMSSFNAILEQIAVSKNGVDLNFFRESPDGDGDEPCYPLAMAAAKGHLEVVAFLCSLPDVNQHVTTEDGVSIFHSAARENQVEVMKYLHTERQFPLDEGDRSALHMAALRSRMEAAEYLLAQGADVNYKTNGRWTSSQTPIFYAAYQGKTEMVRLLLKHGAAVNAIDEAGETPLFDGISCALLEVVQALVEEGGIDVNVANNKGDTAFDYADSLGFGEVAVFLWRAGARSAKIDKASLLLSWQRPYIVNPISPRSMADCVVRNGRVWVLGGYGRPVKPEVRARFLPIADPDDIPTKLPTDPALIKDVDEEDDEDDEEDGEDDGQGVDDAVISADEEDGEEGEEADEEDGDADDDEGEDDGDEEEGEDLDSDEYDDPHEDDPPMSDEDDEGLPHNPSQWFFDVFSCNLQKGVQSGLLFDLIPTKGITASYVNSRGQRNSLDPQRCHSQFMRIIDPCTVAYAGSMIDWAGSVAASQPLRRTDRISYFEVTAVSIGKKREITMGLVSEDYGLDALPGWHYESVALHGDTGQVFCCAMKGRDPKDFKFGPQWQDGDVIGMGVIWETNEVFATFNGEFLGICWNEVPETTTKFYPMIGMRSFGAVAKANFGAQPFLFDFVVPHLSFRAVPGVVDDAPNNTIYVFPKVSNPLMAQYEGEFFFIDVNRLVFLVGKRFAEIPVPSDHCPPVPSAGRNCLIGTKIYIAYHYDSKVPDSVNDVCSLLHVLDLESLTWEFLPIKPPEGVKWNEFLGYGTDLCHVGPNLVFFNHRPYTYVYNTQTLELIQAKPKIYPTGIRSDYAATAISDKELLLHSGYGQRRDSSDTFVFNIDTKEWQTVRHAGGFPSPKAASSAAMVGDKILFVGGIRQGWPFSGMELATISTQAPITSNSSYACIFRTKKAKYFFDSTELYDVEFAAERGGEVFRAHRFLLASRSSVLRDILKGTKALPTLKIAPQTSASDVTKVTVSANVPFAFFKSIIGYLYFDDVEMIKDQDKVGEFLNLVAAFAPEHSGRISEILILSRVFASSTLYKDLQWGLENHLFGDVTFILDKQTFSASKVILCHESQYFNALFLGALRKEGQDSVEIADASAEVFSNLLQFIYSHTIDYDKVGDVIEDLLMCANKYGVVELVAVLESVISANLTDANIDGLLEVATSYGFTRLQTSCNAFKASQAASKPATKK